MRSSSLTSGPKISFGLAKAGHADFLKFYINERSRFDRKVAQVHEDILDELTTNRSGHIGRRMKKLAEDLTSVDIFQTFPLDCYLNPATSPSDDPEQGWPGFGEGDASSARGKARSIGRGDLEGMARACERYFEWGTREIVCKKFASDAVNLFGAEIVAEARSLSRITAPPPRARPTLRPGQSPERITSYFTQSTITTVQGQKSMSTTSTRHLVKIHSTRSSPMCSGHTEYRLEYQPKCYMDRCREAMDGRRADPSRLSLEERVALGLVGEAAGPTDTAVKDEVRIWIADYLVRAAWPHLITKYDDEEAAKAAKKAAPKKKAAAGTAGQGRKKAPVKALESLDAFPGFIKPPATQSAVREVEQAYMSRRVRRDGPAANAGAPNQPTPGLPSPARSGSGASTELSPAPSSPRSFTMSSPIRIPLSLPSPPASPSKRGRPTRSQVPSPRDSSSRDPSPCTGSPVLTPLSTRRSPRKKHVTAPRPTRLAPTPMGSEADPICLLSSDDEPTPRPLRTSRAANTLPTLTPETSPTRGTRDGRGRRAAVATTTPSAAISPPTRPTTGTPVSLPNAPIRTLTTSARPVSPRSALAHSTTTHTPTQTRLDSMIVARARKIQPAAKVPRIPVQPRPPKIPYFVVSEDDEGVEHIDLTQRRPR